MNNALKNCPSCGRALQPYDTVCGTCGAVLQPNAPSPAGPAQPTSQGYSATPNQQAAGNGYTTTPPAPPAPATGVPTQGTGYTAPTPPAYSGTANAPYNRVPTSPQYNSSYVAQNNPPVPTNTGHGPVGAPQSPAAAQQNTYGALGTYSPAPPQQPGNPMQPGMGTAAGGPPPYNPQQPYPSPVPAGYPAMQTQTKKKSMAPVFIIIGVVAVVAIAVVLFVFLGNNGKAEYNTLLTNITAASSPSKVAGFEKELESFVDAHPNLADDDLIELVALCVEYDDADESDYKYDDMISGLEALSGSKVTKIADCADTILSYVEDDYSYYLDSQQDMPDPNDDNNGNGGGGDVPKAAGADNPNFDAEAPIQIAGPTTASQNGTTSIFSFESQNITDKNIDYFEYAIYLYDENGEPTSVILENADYSVGNFLPAISFYAIDANSTKTIEEESVTFEGNYTYAYIFITYVSFEDNTEWGTSILSDSEEAAMIMFNKMPEYNDYAKEHI